MKTPTPDDISFDEAPRKAAKLPKGDVISFARLIDQKRISTDSSRFKARVLALSTYDTQTLILRVSTTEDPLMLWAIHCHLDKRNVAPCLRWPVNPGSEQMLFVSWCADMLWFTRRNPTHKTPAGGKTWPRLFKLTPGSPHWLEQCFWLFAQTMTTTKRTLSYRTSKGLGLGNDQKQDLMTVRTDAMVKTRRTELSTERTEAISNDLLTYAQHYPDKSGKRQPMDIAQRRAMLYRVNVLSGGKLLTTVKYWNALTGEAVSRQTISRHLDSIKMALMKAAYFH